MTGSVVPCDAECSILACKGAEEGKFDYITHIPSILIPQSVFALSNAIMARSHKPPRQHNALMLTVFARRCRAMAGGAAICGVSAPPAIGHARSCCDCTLSFGPAERSISNAIFPSFVQTPRACSPSSLLSFSAIQIIAP